MSITLGTTQILGPTATRTGLSGDSMSNTENGQVIFVYTLPNPGNAIGLVCTVSGTTITTGTEATILSGTNTQSIGVAAMGIGNFGTVVRQPNTTPVGKANANTVSGTTITAGAFTTFYSAGAPTPFAMCGMSTTQFIYAYTKQASANQGWVAGNSVSGTTLTNGTETQAATAFGGTGFSLCSLNSTTFALSYIDANNASRGTANIGTLSGTTVTITNNGGSTFTTNAIGTNVIFALNATTIVVIYNDTTSVACFAVAGTVSGTAITWGTPVQVVGNAVANVAGIGLDGSNFILAYTDSTDGTKLKVLQGSTIGTVLQLYPETRTTVTQNGVSWAANTGTAPIMALGARKFIIGWVDGTGVAKIKGVVGIVTTEGVMSTSLYKPQFQKPIRPRAFGPGRGR